MERVLGIGGLFFRAEDPKALNAWYAEHLGASGGPETEAVWQQEAGPTVWSAFDADTERPVRAVGTEATRSGVRLNRAERWSLRPAAKE